MAYVKLAALLLFVFLLPGCMTAERSVVISDITKGETLILKKQPSQGHISSISLSGKGEVDGNAYVMLMLNGSPYRTKNYQVSLILPGATTGILMKPK